MVRALPMVGRAVERDAMSAAYASAQTGESQLVLITGQAGIGKTRLVEDLCASAADALVLTGESAPLVGTALAYGPFAAALRDHAGWLLEDDQSGDMLSRRHRLFVRVLEVLTELTARAPVLLVLEDLHWADESSLELLGFLTVRLREQQIMVVATLRDDELSSSARRWLAELERRPKVRRLRLAPLTQAEIGEVVADLMPADASEDAKAAVISAAEGIPLYARELATAGPAVVPASITDAVLAKAAGVPALARAVIDQVLGRRRRNVPRAARRDRHAARGAPARRGSCGRGFRPSRLRWRRIRLHAHTGPPGHLRPDSPRRAAPPAPPPRRGAGRPAGFRSRAAGPALAPSRQPGPRG